MSNQVSENSPKQGRSWVLVPVLVFAGLAAIFMTGLRSGDPSKLPSALINQPAPSFDLPALEGLTIDGVAAPGLASGSLAQGRITLVNVWASWCGPCREEHPQLMELAKRDDIDLAGLNYKDQRENALRFLNALGNPYSSVGVDANGRTSVDWGVYGVPETFVINGKGTIVYKFTGPMTEQALREAVIPAIEKARQP
jgi:cytochrome c biogenesis protein CcmG/thiol:disulfide interchange protein DsbE